MASRPASITTSPGLDITLVETALHQFLDTGLAASTKKYMQLAGTATRGSLSLFIWHFYQYPLRTLPYLWHSWAPRDWPCLQLSLIWLHNGISNSEWIQVTPPPPFILPTCQYYFGGSADLRHYRVLIASECPSHQL